MKNNMATNITLNFKPKQITKRLLAVLPTRARDVVSCRFGLGDNPERMTLESIGKKYGITRERVRQIENYAIGNIRKAEQFGKEKPSFDDLEKMIHKLGGIVSEQYKNEEIAKRWLSISKNIGKNPLGEWGKTSSSNINAKGVRDYAFLVIRRHGSPIHFKEVAKAIEKLFGRKAHVATTHNELIKDKRFVLVGRGLYALTEWGYVAGVVKDVIRYVLAKNGPLTKEQIIEKVLKERYVKENTILVNLQNPKYFKRDKDGRYTAVPQPEK